MYSKKNEKGMCGKTQSSTRKREKHYETFSSSEEAADYLKAAAGRAIKLDEDMLADACRGLKQRISCGAIRCENRDALRPAIMRLHDNATRGVLELKPAGKAALALKELYDYEVPFDGAEKAKDYLASVCNDTKNFDPVHFVSACNILAKAMRSHTIPCSARRAVREDHLEEGKRAESLLSRLQVIFKEDKFPEKTEKGIPAKIGSEAYSMALAAVTELWKADREAPIGN